MKPWEHLRELFDGSDEWSEMVDLQNKFADLPSGPGRERVGDRVAVLLESYAARMERSRLVASLASAFTPEGLRAYAAEYRAGRDPHA